MKKSLKRILVCVSCFLIFSSTFAATGIFQTYAIIDVNGTGNQFLAGGINADGAAPYDGSAFGTPSSLILNGGEVKTFKNSGGDVFGAEIFYNIHLQSDPAGSFTAINLPFDSNIGGAPFAEDQKWQEAAAGVDVLAGLPPGDYYLEVFWKATTNEGDRFDSNFGSNFRASFTVAPPAAVPTMGQWGLIILGLSLLSIGAVVVWRKRKQLAQA